MKVLSGLMAVCLLNFAAFSQTLNWTGMLDTAKISGFKADSLKFSKGFPLSKFEDIRVIIKANDTAKAGYLLDSMDIQWGWQTYSLCLDTGHSTQYYDTCFGQRVIADTLDSVAMTRSALVATSDSTGYGRMNSKVADTLHCRGFAVQSKWFLPEWDENVRFWAKGLVGKNRVTGPAIKLEFEVHRRVFVNTRNQ